MRPIVLAVIVAVTFSLPRNGNVARAPDITRQRFELRNAKAFADFLGSSRFALSQAAEHRAMPTHDAQLRDPDGSLAELEVKVSTAVTETSSWDGKVLLLDGYVADLATAFPHANVPRWSFTSPQFTATAVPPGWKDLFEKLQPPAKNEIDFVLADDQRAVITLYRMDTFDRTNQPVVRWSIIVAFGPLITAEMPSDNVAPAAKKKPGC